MTKPISSPQTSGTTGLLPVGSALKNAIGRLRGETGSELRTVRRRPPPVRARQAVIIADRRDPAELLPPLLRASLGTELWVDTAKPDDPHGADMYCVGYSPPAVVDVEIARQVGPFVEALAASMAPLANDDLFVELGKLRVKVIRRTDESEDVQLLFEAYAEELESYPADIVIEVLRLWPKLSKYWPSWDELREPMDRRLRQRKGLLEALETIAQRARTVA